MRITALLAALGLMVALAGRCHADEIDWAKVDTALGKTASVQGDVHRYGIPRSDLQVTVDGVTIKPALALGGWLGFEPMADGALVMGDLVLTETEIEPVMTKLLNSGIDVTALHNHLLRANPATYYMHVHGHGDPVVIATAIRAALAESKIPFGPPAAPRLKQQRSTSTRQLWTTPSALRGRSTAVSISSRFHARMRSRITEPRCHRPWEPPR